MASGSQASSESAVLRPMDLAYLISSQMVDAREAIVSHLGPKDFLALERTSKCVRASVNGAKESVVYNVDKKLKKYFSDPKAFRRVQASTGALIGGEFARQFFANQHPETSNELQIYNIYYASKCEKNRRILYECLMTSGWRPCFGPDWENEPASTTFHHISEDMSDLAVLVLDNYCSSLLQLLYDAATTASLNFIAWNKAYSLFPWQTFMENQAYLLRNPMDAEDGVNCRNSLRTLKKHGIKIKTRAWEDVSTDVDSKVALPRRIGNKETWIIALTTCDIDVQDAPPDTVIEASTFKIYTSFTHADSLNPVNQYYMNTSPLLNYAILKHAYLAVTRTKSGHSPPGPWELADDLGQLDDKLTDVTKLELLQLDEDDLPEQYDEFLDQYHGNEAIAHFSWEEDHIPEGWSFFDDDLVKQLDKLWVTHVCREAKAAAKRKKDDGEEEEGTKGGDGWSQEGEYAGDI